MQTLPLEQLADIRSGIHFRSGLVDSPEGGVNVVQIRDLSPEGIDLSSVLRTDLESDRKIRFLQEGDIIVNTRTTPFFGVCVTKEMAEAGNYIASGLLTLITPKRDTSGNFVVSPHYLAWYFSQLPAQKYIESRAMGSTVRSLPVAALGAMPIVRFSLEKEAAIVQLAQSFIQERRILDQLKENSHMREAGVAQRLFFTTRE